MKQSTQSTGKSLSLTVKVYIYLPRAHTSSSLAVLAAFGVVFWKSMRTF